MLPIELVNSDIGELEARDDDDDDEVVATSRGRGK